MISPESNNNGNGGRSNLPNEPFIWILLGIFLDLPIIFAKSPDSILYALILHPKFRELMDGPIKSENEKARLQDKTEKKLLSEQIRELIQDGRYADDKTVKFILRQLDAINWNLIKLPGTGLK
jgi:hypothetical protein